MVRALLAGTKTQTRRIVKPNAWVDEGDCDYSGQCVKVGESIDLRRCPYGQPGDRLWVREKWSPLSDARMKPGPLVYAADGERGAFIGDGGGGRCWIHHGWTIGLSDHDKIGRWHGEPACWIPSIHMPRWASRITLEITGVRVERLQEISESDAKAEGATCRPIPKPWGADPGWCMDWSRVGQRDRFGHDGGTLAESDICLSSARHSFWNFFDKINGPGSWDANPWVWAVEFRRIAP
jgi:hypothetical protein